MKHKLIVLAALSISGMAAQAQPAVIYDMGGKFDKSFNEAAYNGAERWKKEGGKPYLDFEIANEAQREQAMRRMADKGANPKAEVFVNMVGTTGAAWNDPARGGELARSQFAKGADVVFAAAGGTGIGVYQAAKDSGKFAIGVDSNQNHLQPGTMLTSMVKRVDLAVYEAAKSHKPGMVSLGLKEDAVDYALDQYNAKLISADIKKKVDQAKADVIAGKIKVADYMADNACKF